MGLISRLREHRATSQSIGHPRDPVVAGWFGGGSNSATGLSVTPDSAMKVTAVFRCVNLLAQTYASLPLGVFRERGDGGKDLDKNHPLYRVIHDQPNKWQTSFEWREMMAAHFALRGACYSEIISSGGRAVDQLIPLHPDHVRPFRAPDGRMAFESRSQNGPARIILQDEMHWMHLLPIGGDSTKPFSPISLCREAIGLSLATEEHAARLFSNGARPGGILKMTGHLKDDPARERFKRSWQEVQGGLRNTGKVALLEDGMEWQALGMTNEDAQFIETRGLQLGEIGRIFGVPAHKFNDLSRATFSNIEHQGIEFVTDTIRPFIERWEDAMQRDLFFGARTHIAEFDLDGLMRGDSAARASFNASALQNGYSSRNEIRTREGRNVSADEGMDAYTVQSNLIAIGDLGKNFIAPGKQPGAQDAK